MNADGHADVLVTATYEQLASPATVQVFSGVDGSVLMTLSDYWQTFSGGIGNAIAAGDVDGNGRDDVVVAQLDPGSTTSAIVELATRGLDVPTRVTRHGDPYEMRVPVGIGVRVPTEELLGQTMIVSLRGAQAFSEIAALWVGTSATVPLDPIGMVGATIHVRPFLSVVAIPSAGWATSTSSADVPLTWPDSPGLVGATIELQWVHEDRWAPNPWGLALTEALTLELR
ncbi:MAG: VCBS repeat-containing protein [Planctomycetes bacterium]|nr:VCBS repeat-containing protein [Planctomycetota bacterium]